MKFSDAMEDFLYEKAIGTAEATQRYYAERLRYFQRDTGIQELHEFTPRLVARYFHTNRHLAPATIDNYWRGLSVFANWCYRRKLLNENPFDALPKPKRTRAERPSHFTREQVRAIVMEAKRSRNSKWLLALVMILLDTGVRIGEAANLLVPDVDWDKKLLVVNGKTGSREVPFSGKTKFALSTYVRKHRRALPSELHVFVNTRGVPQPAGRMSENLRRLAQRAGVEGPKLGAHTYRHTFAINYIKNGGDAYSLQRILGHTTMKMTSIYTRMNSEDLRLLHARHSPLRSLL